MNIAQAMTATTTSRITSSIPVPAASEPAPLPIVGPYTAGRLPVTGLGGAGAPTRRARACGLSASLGVGERDARCGDSGSEHDADRGKIDQRLALGGGVAGHARLLEAASSDRQRRRPSRFVQFELNRDFLKRLVEVSLHVTLAP